jgi:small subunit ribosomal protein S27Ae
MAEAAKKPAKKVAAYKAGRSCPKCGGGTRLAEHADRRACGKCGYMEKK